MDGKCCVCSSEIYTEAAHVKAERDFPLFDNDRMKNLLPLCPTCHKYCDHPINAITLHPDWKCWVFSDKPSFYQTTTKIKFKNPYSKFLYAFPPPQHRHMVNMIEIENILHSNRTEFSVRDGYGAAKFFERMERKLKSLGRWNQEENRPKYRTINSTMSIDDSEEP